MQGSVSRLGYKVRVRARVRVMQAIFVAQREIK